MTFILPGRETQEGTVENLCLLLANRGMVDFLVSSFQLHLAQNNPYTKVAYFGVANATIHYSDLKDNK